MAHTQSVAVAHPTGHNLDALRREAAACRACELWKLGTQTVFGEGPPDARVMLVGEQPGDQEDVQGEPFVGPAGKLLDRALEQAGLDRDEVYLTNAVKHFRWEPRGKRRIHKKPGMAHVKACRPWLDAEIGTVKAEAIVLLGATAATSVLGPRFRLTEHRGEFLETELDALVTATVHPSSILRARDATEREAGMAGFVRDLTLVAQAVQP
jgi:uracil-DNA glycosylase family protein